MGMTILEALKGKHIYIKNKLHKYNGLIIILPDNNQKLRDITIKCARNYKNKFAFPEITFISVSELKELSCENGELCKVIDKKTMNNLVAYILLKMDAMHRTVLNNIKLVTLHYYNDEYNYQIENELFDIEYLVWNRMFYTNEEKVMEGVNL